MTRPFWPTLYGLLEDERGVLSSKRVVGVSAAFTIIGIAIVQLLGPWLLTAGGVADPPKFAVDATVMDALTWLAVGGLGWATVDKFNPKARAEAEIAKARSTQELRAMPEGG